MSDTDDTTQDDRTTQPRSYGETTNAYGVVTGGAYEGYTQVGADSTEEGDGGYSYTTVADSDENAGYTLTGVDSDSEVAVGSVSSSSLREEVYDETPEEEIVRRPRRETVGPKNVQVRPVTGAGQAQRLVEPRQPYPTVELGELHKGEGELALWHAVQATASAEKWPWHEVDKDNKVVIGVRSLLEDSELSSVPEDRKHLYRREDYRVTVNEDGLLMYRGQLMDTSAAAAMANWERGGLYNFVLSPGGAFYAADDHHENYVLGLAEYHEGRNQVISKLLLAGAPVRLWVKWPPLDESKTLPEGGAKCALHEDWLRRQERKNARGDIQEVKREQVPAQGSAAGQEGQRPSELEQRGQENQRRLGRVGRGDTLGSRGEEEEPCCETITSEHVGWRYVVGVHKGENGAVSLPEGAARGVERIGEGGGFVCLPCFRRKCGRGHWGVVSPRKLTQEQLDQARAWCKEHGEPLLLKGLEAKKLLDADEADFFDHTACIAAPSKLELFHHSSFLAGGPVACAGTMGVRQGRIEFVSNDSGHYGPPDYCLTSVVRQLLRDGADLSQLQLRLYNKRDDRGQRQVIRFQVDVSKIPLDGNTPLVGKELETLTLSHKNKGLLRTLFESGDMEKSSGIRNYHGQTVKDRNYALRQALAPQLEMIRAGIPFLRTTEVPPREEPRDGPLPCTKSGCERDSSTEDFMDYVDGKLYCASHARAKRRKKLGGLHDELLAKRPRQD